jgi:hypothetical protein
MTVCVATVEFRRQYRSDCGISFVAALLALAKLRRLRIAPLQLAKGFPQVPAKQAVLPLSSWRD